MYQHMDGMVLDYQLDHALVASLVALFCTMQERFLPVERNWQVHRRFLCVRPRQRREKSLSGKDRFYLETLKLQLEIHGTEPFPL